MSSSKKDINKILLVLSLIGLADGIFYNFLELWMSTNGLTIKTISVVISLCQLLSVSTIFLFSNVIRREYLKKLICILLSFKLTISLLLFILNSTGLNIMIKFLIMISYVVDVELITSIYPLLSQINKDDKLYAKKGLIYNGFKYGGIVFTTFALGKTLFSVTVNYNSYYIISSILVLLALIIFCHFDYSVYLKKDNKKVVNGEILDNLVKKVKKDKISIIYLLSNGINEISYSGIIGLKMLILTEVLLFEPTTASNFYTILGLISVIVGALILSKLTLKNNYINLLIKFGGRFILYLLAVILNNKLIFLIAIAYSLFFSESYGHIVDAPYINRIDKEYQFAFCNLKEMIVYLGGAIGTYICGIAIMKGLRFNFFIALIFCIIQTILRLLNEHNRIIDKKEKLA